MSKLNDWPDAVRQKMNERSKFYAEPRIYTYGFYDAWQYQHDKIVKAIDLIQKARTAEHPDAVLQDALIILNSDFTNLTP